MSGYGAERTLPISQHFNPPTPCGVGLDGDLFVHGGLDFNPPTPCGVGPEQGNCIHQRREHFNPPTPCGVGPVTVPALLVLFQFQSTHPVWGGTC